MENDPRYVPVGQALPDTLPPLDRATAAKRARQLVRHFGRLGLGSPNQTRPASLNDWGISNWSGRRVWISTKPTKRDDHHKGWGRLIHDVSHIVFAARHPSFRPHDGGHAAVEREMAEYVVRKGWIFLQPVKEKPLRKVVALERDKVRLAKWMTREKRAHNAVKKLKRSIARRERSLS